MSARPVRLGVRLLDAATAEVDAYPTPVPGLVIHAVPEADGLWAVTLDWCGVAVCPGFLAPEAALGAAIDMGPLADWTRPTDREAIYDRMSMIVTRWGALDVPVLSDDEAKAAGVIA